MTITENELRDLVKRLAESPTEALLISLISRLVTEGLNIDSREIILESRILFEEKGITSDLLFGRIVFEIRHNLGGQSLVNAEHTLLRYINAREKYENSYIGIATDGILFRIYKREDQNNLKCITEYSADSDKPEELIKWLDDVFVGIADFFPSYLPTKQT